MIQNTIFTTILKTPIKEMFVAMFNDELIIFTPYEKEFCTKELNQFKKILGVDFIIEDDDKFIYFKEELKKYVAELIFPHTYMKDVYYKEILGQTAVPFDTSNFDNLGISKYSN